jgi:hypothetical protein
MILFIGLFFNWLYALGINLYKKLPATAPMSLTRFKIFLFMPFTYMVLLSLYMSVMFSRILSDDQLNSGMFAWIFPLHLFSMFCIFYCFYFNAKALKSVELQMPATFSDFAGELFLIWFFPIGVWIIQPRINKMFDTTIANDENQIPVNNL